MCRVVFLFSFALVGLAPSHAQDQSPPFLYYYSYDETAFVIERSDGTDHRILAPYTLPEESIVLGDGEGYLTGPGWSSSGEWFAWTYFLRNGIPGRSAFVVNRTGSQVSEIIEAAMITDMVWSPNADLMLVAYRETHDSTVQNVHVYDPASGSTLMDTRGEDLTGDKVHWLHSVGWSPNGDYITLLNGRTMEILDVSNDTHISLNTADVPFTGCGDFGVLPNWLDHERIAFFNPQHQEIVVKSLSEANNAETVTLPEGEIRLVDWSADNNYALVYIQPSPNQFQYGLWMLSLEGLEINRVSEAVYLLSNCNDPFQSTLWSDINQAVFISEDKQLYLVNAPSNSISVIPLPEDSEVETSTPIRWTSTGEIVFVVYFPNSYRNEIYKYNPESNSLTLLTPSDPDNSFQTEYFSTIRDNHFIYNEMLVDITTGTQQQILHPPPELASLQFFATNVAWHPSENWLLALSFGWEGLYRVYVTDTEGASQRRLTICLAEAISCYGWMP